VSPESWHEAMTRLQKLFPSPFTEVSVNGFRSAATYRPAHSRPKSHFCLDSLVPASRSPPERLLGAGPVVEPPTFLGFVTSKI